VVNTVIKNLLMRSLVRLSRRPKVKVSLERLEGLVVDIGAGGEGIMAKTCGKETVCVDISKREIDEARSRGAVANWVLCDARAMPFGSGLFDVATFFFSLMYMKTLERKHAVMIEAKRVLKPEGSLYLWDAIIREKPDPYIVFVEASLPGEERVYTGYGVRGEKKEQAPELINQLALEAGFRDARTESHECWFTSRFQ